MFKSIRVGAAKGGARVVGVFEGESRKLPAEIRDAYRTPGFKAEPGETIPAGKDRFLVGLGKRSALKVSTLRTIGGQLVRALDRMGQRAASLDIARSVPAKVAKAEVAGQAIAEGMGLANWRVDFFDGEASKTEKPAAALTITSADDAFRRGLKTGLTLTSCANEARRLAATPPNICNPSWLTSEVKKMARAVGLTCRVISYTQAQQQGMGGLVNVGRGSDSKPCLIILEHKPARARAGEHVVLVGKTITYDTGGYSLKISNGMKGMKYDKNGGMAVLGAMRAIASLKLPVRVTALLPAAENMVSSDAYRPDDIITMYNGVTVEVTNTDAEGRLVLADALAYACRKCKPTAIIDAATLTGGVVVALGFWSAGVFCNDEKLLKRLDAASKATGERIWRLPLWDDHRDFMRAKHADLWNSGPKRDGHAIQGAAFLSFFVDEDVPWAHLDIAGVNAVDSDTPLCVTGPTGYGVRLLTEVVRGYAGK
ncbi:MAG: leucyl aminopeptidase family protein [Planctomycetota bacterium]